MSLSMDDFFIDLLTYDCPFTGRKRCAVSALNDVPTIKLQRTSAEYSIMMHTP